jgi:apolipoprotein N-acyltransferase
VRPYVGSRGALGCAAASAACFALAQPPTGLWPLAFVALAPLLVALAGRDLVARAKLGALCGSLAALAVAVGPAATGAAEFSGRPWWQAWIATALVGQLFGGVGFAVFAALAGDPLRAPLGRAALRAGLAFAAAELVRSTMLGGLPWLLLAHALAASPHLLGLAPLGGVGLLSAWLAAIALAIARTLVGPARARAAVSALVLLAVGTGVASLPSDANVAVRRADAATKPAGALRVGLVQPALPMAQWSDPARTSATVDHLVALSSVAARAQAIDLLVWPENAIQALLPANDAQVEKALRALGGDVSHLLLGAPRYAPARPTERFNAALLYRGAREPVAIHDKTRLLPFFEATPAWLARGDAGLTAGRSPAVLRGDERISIGALLCYEVLFPAVAQRQVRDGATLLVNLSNDAWFAGSGGAEQHFAAAVVLAATFARPLLRATPSGVTAAVAASGRVVARLPADRPGTLVVDVFPSFVQTPAARLGDAPAWVALGLATLWTCVTPARSRA